MDADTILKAVNSVTKDWTKRRKAEERTYRPRRTYHSRRVNFTDVAHQILPKAYAHASGNGAFTLPKRNFYYAARDDFFQATGREITYAHFQTVLLQYMNRFRKLTASWKITADPRGNFEIPNCDDECRIPVGTLEIDNYLATIACPTDDIMVTELPIQWPSKAPGQRFAALLYIEKEGFGPMLKEAKIADRYDLAIISCKGQSVVAARKLVDHICNESGVPLFVVHDFDKAGFEICKSLTTESAAAWQADRVAYYFENRINVTDFGLRLDDALAYDLSPETVTFKGETHHLGMTKEEKEFLLSDRRIELNAFTCEQFIDWLEKKLDEHLPERLIPVDEILEEAFRRACVVAKVNRVVVDATEDAKAEAEELGIPDDFRDQVTAAVEESNDPWDVAVYRIAEAHWKEDS